VIYRSTVGVDRSSREVWRWVEDPTMDQWARLTVAEFADRIDNIDRKR
jgi:hypothetical protein